MAKRTSEVKSDMKCKDDWQLRSLCTWIEMLYPTGSAVIGGYEEGKSDIDYLVEYDGAVRFLKTIDLALPKMDVSKRVEYADCKRFISYKYRRREKDPWFNLIVLADYNDVLAWWHATDTCTGDPKCLDRTERKRRFGMALNAWYREHSLEDRAVWLDTLRSKDRVAVEIHKRNVGLAGAPIPKNCEYGGYR